MTQTIYDHSGRPLPSPSLQDDGYEYNPTGPTQAGDEVYHDYGMRWRTVVALGEPMAACLRYRRPKKGNHAD